MGANNVIPVVPTFTAGPSSIAQLNQLSYAVNFLVNQSVRPTWKLFKTTTQAVTSGAWANVAYDHTAYDCDGVQNYPGVKIVTQGYYSLEACVQVEVGANKDNFACAFLWTAGANSPYSAQSPLLFGFNGCATAQTSSANADNALCISDITPIPMYPLDTLDVQVYLSANHTLDFNQNTSFDQGRLVMEFTGYWSHEGS